MNEKTYKEIKEKTFLVSASIGIKFDKIFVTEGDILSEGYLAYHKTIKNFNPNKKCSFNSYWSIKIRSQLLDYLRKIDDVSRPFRKLIKEGKFKYEKIPIQDFETILACHLFSTKETIENETLQKIDIESILYNSCLNNLEKSLIKGYYLNSLSLKELSKIHKKSSTWLHHIKKIAIRKLKREYE